MSDKVKEVVIKYRDARIAYEVDEKSVAEFAEMNGIDWDDAKKVLMAYGITVRKTEKRPEDGPKPYIIILADSDKVVKEPAKAPVAAN